MSSILKTLFQNHYWNFIKLFYTALIWASRIGHTEVAKVLIEQNGIDINDKNVCLIF